ncbi:zinc finger protein 260 [Amyelois transitella]|uniref:zinc finger protein 260 n=1 Tax=Amyelois transitella TaxID=680683 RepID=UPI00067BA225|nr:zinc finger protein 260 [Amyelois transitella]
MFFPMKEGLCAACLCVGRNLDYISGTADFDFYSQILNEIDVYNTSTMHIPVCWECRALMRRLRRFKSQVKQSYQLLKEAHENGIENLVRPPHLSVHNLCLISVPFDDIVPKVEPESEASKADAEVKSEPEDHAEHCEETFVNDLLVEQAEPAEQPAKSKAKEKAKMKKTEKKTIKKRVRKRRRKKSVSSESIDNVDVGIDCDTRSVEAEREGVEEAKEKGERESVQEGVGEETVAPPRDTERPQCVECGKVFSSKKTYRYHLNVLHKGQNRYPCPRCGKVYQWKSNLGRHMRSHKARDAGELYCGECDKRFASVATFRQHLRVSKQHVTETEFTFMCTVCGKKFVNKTRLRDHVDWEHLHNIKFRCQLCNKPFKCHTSLYVHMQNVHRNKEKKDNLCHVCGKSYQNAAKLKYHIVAMHTHETPYRCAHCAAAFGWYSSLYRHVREVHYKMKLQPKKSKRPKRGELPLLPVPVHPAQP